MTTVTAPAPAPEAKKNPSSTPMPVGPQRVLNVPLLIITFVVLIVVGLSVYFWHSFMVDHTADAFLIRAEALEKEKDWNSASRYLHRYLQVHPDDVEAHVRLAKVFDKSATELRQKPRAIALYYEALGVAQDDLELRERLLELLLELGQFQSARLGEAEKQASELLQKDTENQVALRAMALTAYASTRARLASAGSIDSVVAKFVRGLKLHPGDIEMAKTLAHIYRNELKQPSEEERNELANEVMRKMTEASPDDPEAWLTLFLYRKLYSLPDAQDAIDKAVSLGPDNLEVLLAAGENALSSAMLARQEERWDDVTTYFLQAEKYYQRVIEVQPKNERGYLGLGQAKLLNERAGEAISTWQAGLKECGRENLDLNMQIVRTQIILGQLDTVEKTLDLLDHEFEKLGPRMTQAQSLMAQNMINYMRGKLYFGRQDYRKTIDLMEGVVSTFTTLAKNQFSKRSVAEFYDASMTLGRAYGATGQWDLAAQEFIRATKLKPEEEDAKRQAANALVQSGKHSEAMKFMSGLNAQGAEALGVWLAKAETELRRQLGRPLAERDWRSLHAMLSSPPEALRKSWQLKLLESDYILARGGEKAGDTAYQFLLAAEKLHPDAPDLYQKLTLIYQRLGKPEEADRALKKLGLLDLDGGNLRYSLVKAELLTLRSDFDGAEELLRGIMDPLPEAQQTPIRYTLFRLYLQRGDAVAARTELEKLNKQLPTDANLVYQLAELTLEMGDYDGVKKWSDELKKLDGEDSARWRYFAAERLVNLAKDEKDPKLEEASKLQEYIEARRTTWPQGHLLKGDIALKRNDVESAIRSYMTAIDQGEARVGIYERLIEMLYVAKRYEDAQKYLDQLQDFVMQSNRLQMFDILLSEQRGNRRRARELAEKATRRRPDDPHSWIRLGQAWLAEDDKVQAEAAFRKSVEVGPADIQCWNALVTFLIRVGRTADAVQSLEDLRTGNHGIDPLQQNLFLGRAHELLGRRSEAEPFFKAALDLKPDDVNIQVDVAEFYERSGKDEESKKLLRAAYKQRPQDDRIRVRLAELLIQGNEAESEEASKLLEAGAVGANATPANRRILANFLAKRGIDHRAKAIELYEALVANDSEREPMDQIRLAYLYELDRRIEPANRELTRLAGAPGADPAHIVQLIEFQLRHDMAVAATNYVKELSKLEPNSFRTLNIQTRWLKAQGRNKDIEPLVEHFARNRRKEIDNQSQEALVMLNVGRIYTAVGLHDQALRWFQELHDLNPKAYRPLASALTSVGRSEDAMKLCLAKANEAAGLREAVDVIAEVLTSGKSTPQDYEMAKGLLTQARREFGESIPMLFTLALIHASQQEPEEAIKLYKQILERSPKEVASLNNLAYVLLDVPGRTQEGLEYINRAIDIEGSNSALLDTKGMLLLESQPAQAVKLFEEATSVPTNDPRYLFHLAVGYKRIGSSSKARVSLATAVDLGLRDQLLTGTEKKLLIELDNSLRN